MIPVGRSLVALALVTVAACAAPTGAGSVVMKVSDTQAHVRLDKEVPAGARVGLYRDRCVSQAGKRYACRQLVAVGTVVDRIGDNHALVTFPRGTQYEEGYKLERVTDRPAAAHRDLKSSERTP